MALRAFHISIFDMILRERRKIVTLPDRVPSGKKSAVSPEVMIQLPFDGDVIPKHTIRWGSSQSQIYFPSA
jgi:hypothetical protein